MTIHETDFLGKGWAFPPSFSRGANTADMVSKQEDINQSLGILLSTSLGERFLQPTYGCNLHDYLFESLDDSMKSFLEDLIRTAILLHEPRIKLDRIEMFTKPLEGLILFEIYYWIRTTNTRANFVYPFYFKEGTDL
jgi:phage baseplate assembly protein W